MGTVYRAEGLVRSANRRVLTAWRVSQLHPAGGVSGFAGPPPKRPAMPGHDRPGALPTGRTPAPRGNSLGVRVAAIPQAEGEARRPDAGGAYLTQNPRSTRQGRHGAEPRQHTKPATHGRSARPPIWGNANYLSVAMR